MPSGGNPMASILSAKPTAETTDKKEKHKFWDTQPMPKLGSEILTEGPLEMQTIDQVQKEPCSLPPNFSW